MKMPYVDEFLDYYRIYRDASKYTIVNYKKDMEVFFEFTNGKYNVSKLTIMKYTKYLLKEKKLKNTTVNRRLSSLKSYFNYLYNEEIIDNNPGNHIRFVKKPKIKHRNLPSQKEIFKVLDKIDDVRDRALLETLYSTGVREGELSALNIEDIDFENKIVTIFGKGGKTRIVPISNKALEYITAYIKSRKEGALFLNNRYTRLGERSIYNIVKKYFNMSPHELRHCFSTHILTKTGNIKAVSELLGHSSIAVTEKIYVHFNINNLKEVYKNSGMDR